MNKNYIILFVVFVALAVGSVLLLNEKSAPLGPDGYRDGQDLPPLQAGTESPSPLAVESVSPTPTPIEPVVSNKPTRNRMNNVTLKTNFGDITFETYDLDAPKTVANFLALANKKYYDNVIFHRVIKDFMIQGGDPTGTGRGGPGYQFEDELNANTASYKAGYKRGVVAMANAGPNTNGSQFFIMHQDYPLPNDYTIFGKVTAGQNVVDKIAESATDPNDRPLKDVVIQAIEVVSR